MSSCRSLEGRKRWSASIISDPRCGVLFLSGYSARVVATKDDTAYGRAYLRKPFTVDDLEQKVREVLDANDEPPAA